MANCWGSIAHRREICLLECVVLPRPLFWGVIVSGLESALRPHPVIQSIQLWFRAQSRWSANRTCWQPLFHTTQLEEKISRCFLYDFPDFLELTATLISCDTNGRKSFDHNSIMILLEDSVLSLCHYWPVGFWWGVLIDLTASFSLLLIMAKFNFVKPQLFSFSISVCMCVLIKKFKWYAIKSQDFFEKHFTNSKHFLDLFFFFYQTLYRGINTYKLKNPHKLMLLSNAIFLHFQESSLIHNHYL